MFQGTVSPALEAGWQMPPPQLGQPLYPQDGGAAAGGNNGFSFLQYRAAAQPSKTPRTDLPTTAPVAHPTMQVMSRGAVSPTVAQANEVNLLIKDPEVSNKTWTVPVPDNATVAEVVKLFLLRRNEDLRQACQLKVSHNGYYVTDELDKTIQEFGITGRNFLQSMWTPSAGGCPNAATCPRCQKIINADSVNASPRKDTADGNPFLGEDPGRDAFKGADRKEKHQGEKEKKRHHKKQQQDQYDLRLRDVVDRVKGGGREGSTSTAAADLVLVLDRLVATVTHATDVVGQLERLYKLHSRGALTDAEYSMAKQQVLFGEE